MRRVAELARKSSSPGRSTYALHPPPARTTLQTSGQPILRMHSAERNATPYESGRPTDAVSGGVKTGLDHRPGILLAQHGGRITRYRPDRPKDLLLITTTECYGYYYGPDN